MRINVVTSDTKKLLTSWVGSGLSDGAEHVDSGEGSHFAASGGNAVEGGADLLGVGLCGQDESGQVWAERQREEQQAVNGKQDIAVSVA